MINWPLLANPINWVIVFLMVLIGTIALTQLLQIQSQGIDPQ